MKVIVTNKTESVIYNGEIYRCDDTFETDDAIAKSLIERGYVKEVTDTESLPEAEVVEGHLDEAQLEEMQYCDLKRLAAQLGLDATGKKPELVERIRNHKISVPEEAVIEEEAEVEETNGELPNTAMPD